MLRFSCQTITYGDPQSDRFSEILEDAAAAGYAGVEIGFRRLQNVEPPRMKEMLKTKGLVLSGSHIGGNLEDSSQADRERSVLDTVLEYLQALEVPTLMYSGLRYEDAGQFASDLEKLNTAVVKARRHEVRLLYHNHNWEFHDRHRIMNALLADGAPELGLCADVGWIEKAGTSALEFLERAKDRVKMIHFKDFATRNEEKVDTVLFGDGVVPLIEIASWIRQNFSDMWIVAEQDTSDISARRTIQANFKYLQNCFA